MKSTDNQNSITSKVQTNILNPVRVLFRKILDWPVSIWVLTSFFVVFLFYFILPTFLNAYHELRLFPEFPVLKPLGADLNEILKFSRALVDTGTPYTPMNYYPPFEAIFFLRFMYSGPDQSYIYITVLSFLSFLAMTFFYPLLSSGHHRLNSLAVFGIITGLFSYGLWFELERGQFDLLVMVICYAAIFLYHRYPRLRLVAYLLFVISVNLKIYPAIFILCFTTDWHDWKNNLRRWILLILANIAGLFVLGWNVFIDFVHALNSQMSQPSYWWAGNHSADSFVRVVIEALKGSNPGLYSVLNANLRWAEILLLLIYAVCLIGVLWLAYRRKMSANNPYLLLIFTLGALIIPSSSHDYKLCLLIPPMILLFNNLDLQRSEHNWLDLSAILLTVIISLSYSTTLFLHLDFPLILANNFPALMILSIASVLLLWIRSGQAKRITDQTGFQDLV